MKFFDILRGRKEVEFCPNCNTRLINLGPLGHYCAMCKAFIGEMPERGLFVVTGGSGTGKTMFLYKCARVYVEAGKPCIFVACDQEPQQIRKSLKDLGCPMFEKGKWGVGQQADFVLLDAFSGTAGMKSDEEFSVEGTYSLNDISLAIDKCCERYGDKPKAVILDSANPLFIYNDPDTVVRFLHLSSSRQVARNTSFYFSLTPGAVGESAQKRLEAISDGIIELRTLEGEGRTIRQLRISKMRGKKMEESWVEFTVLPGEGFAMRHIDKA